MTLDLAGAPLARTGITEIDAAVGLGEMLVVVPEDARVTVESSVRAGGVDLAGRRQHVQERGRHRPGIRPARRARQPRLHLDLSVEFGTLEVVRG